MHVLFLAPETGLYNLRFLDGLVRRGAELSALGHAPRERLSPELARLLTRYVRVQSLFEHESLLAHAREIARARPIERIETIDEPAIVAAAQLRGALGVAGQTVGEAQRCRDKALMKEAFRAAGIPCAASIAAHDDASVHAFVEREGLPIVLKPLAGFGTLDTFKAGTQQELAQALARLRPSRERPIIIEEYVEGHEGFYDTLSASGVIAHDFVGHYYPTCLEATFDRAVRPQIACSNRIEDGGYVELRAVGARVAQALGIKDGAMHMEWFFGPKGLKISEAGARPAGERIWDLHVAGNEFDLYGDWAQAILHGTTEHRPTRRYSTGSVQIRPDRDGRYVGHEGLERVRKELGDALIESAVPHVGAPTLPLDKGWHVNTWFRVRDTDYDRLRSKLDFIARTVHARAR